jgi:glycosyltransferase involved in cell wall biosynthesis
MASHSAESEPLVSVVCFAHNHERFIRQAVDSFLAQETDFPFEILVNDDFSTDNTAALLRAYEEAHPGRFRRIRQPFNRFSRGELGRMWIEIFHAARGRFVALCEGDDFWTEPSKLQRQVDQLQSRPECAGIFHRGHAVDEEGRRIPFVWDGLSYRAEYTQAACLTELRSGYPTASLMFRRSRVLGEVPDYYLRTPYDFMFDLFLTEHGVLGFEDFDGSAYRQHPGGIWSPLDRKEMQRLRVDRLTSLLRSRHMQRRYPELTDMVFRQMDIAWWHEFDGTWSGWLRATGRNLRSAPRWGLVPFAGWIARSRCPVRFELRDLISGKRSRHDRCNSPSQSGL